MAGMVQTDLGPHTATRYKEEPVGDPLRRATPGHQNPRSAGLVQQRKRRLSSPHQPPTSLPPDAYAPSHPLGNGVLQHQTPYPEPTQDTAYYTSHPAPYTASSEPGPPDPMASTTQMHRPYPPIYHTPQSSSPASVGSQNHDQHGRNIYTQSPQMATQLYGYQSYSPMDAVQPSPYAPHASPQQHPLTTQPLMMPPQNNSAPVQPPPQTSSSGITTSPTATAQQQPSQRGAFNPPQSGASGSANSTSNVHQAAAPGASSSAAPGPIPATTPLVVRQDGNGVQWIAFEYSRDRVKMEYTIRCDVESVNVDALSPEFKTENCVYPRACCSKDQYRGNRLVYETECNAVGWALAELNPALRGKRGLIQRAVDSWRNSNQDPRLRSRRVRRIAKVNRRQTIPAQPPSHVAAATPVGPGAPGASMPTPRPRPAVSPMTMGPPQLHHHHHAHPDGSPGNEGVSGIAEFPNGTLRPAGADGHPASGRPGTDIRSAQVFHDYPAFPPSANASGGAGGPSMPPLIRDSSGIGNLGRHPAVATSSSRGEETEDDEERHPSNEALFGTHPDGKRRKFILVDDNQRGCRVRVKVMLDQVNMNEIPDSYRMSNAVYPRTYFPVQMKSPPGRVVPGKRFFKGDPEEMDDDDDEAATVGSTMVPAPQIDGESEIAVPKLSRGRRRREVFLNDLGYRMSWSQSRVFAGRMLFLQRSLDAYRNKMRSTMLAAGQEPASIPAHFETRAGKRRFLERGRRRTARGSTMSASKRSAEEVES